MPVTRPDNEVRYKEIMKKTLLIAILCLLLSTFFTSCNNAIQPDIPSSRTDEYGKVTITVENGSIKAEVVDASLPDNPLPDVEIFFAEQQNIGLLYARASKGSYCPDLTIIDKKYPAPREMIIALTPAKEAAWITGNPVKLDISPEILPELWSCYYSDMADYINKHSSKIKGILFLSTGRVNDINQCTISAYSSPFPEIIFASIHQENVASRSRGKIVYAAEKLPSGSDSNPCLGITLLFDSVPSANAVLWNSIITGTNDKFNHYRDWLETDIAAMPLLSDTAGTDTGTREIVADVTGNDPQYGEDSAGLSPAAGLPNIPGINPNNWNIPAWNTASTTTNVAQTPDSDKGNVPSGTPSDTTPGTPSDNSSGTGSPTGTGDTTNTTGPSVPADTTTPAETSSGDETIVDTSDDEQAGSSQTIDSEAASNTANEQQSPGTEIPAGKNETGNRILDRGYYQSGELSRVSEVDSNGKLTTTQYYKNGQTKSIEHTVKSDPKSPIWTVKDGVLEGWYENGQKSVEYVYNNGVMESCDRWHTNGVKSHEDIYTIFGDTRIGTHSKWNENGQLMETHNTRNGFWHGLQVWYRPDGIKEREIVDNLDTGLRLERNYRPDGTLYCQKAYDMNKSIYTPIDVAYWDEDGKPYQTGRLHWADTGEYITTINIYYDDCQKGYKITKMANNKVIITKLDKYIWHHDKYDWDEAVSNANAGLNQTGWEGEAIEEVLKANSITRDTPDDTSAGMGGGTGGGGHP